MYIKLYRGKTILYMWVLNVFISIQYQRHLSLSVQICITLYIVCRINHVVKKLCLAQAQCSGPGGRQASPLQMGLYHTSSFSLSVNNEMTALCVHFFKVLDMGLWAKWYACLLFFNILPNCSLERSDQIGWPLQ